MSLAAPSNIRLHGKCATTKTSTENARPEKSFPPLGASFKNARPENAYWLSVAITDNAPPEKHSCVQRWPPKVGDQKNNILAFRGGHFKCPTRNKDNEQRKQPCMRKCATRKKTKQRTTQTPATTNCATRNTTRPEKKIPWSGAATENARPEKHSFVQRWPPKVRDQKKQRSGVQGRPSKMPDQKNRQRAAQTTLYEKMRDHKHIPAFRGGHRQCATRKINPSVRGVLERCPTRKSKTTNKENTCYEKLRDQKQHIPAFRGGHSKCATRKKKHSGVQGMSAKMRDQKKNILAFRCGHRKCATSKTQDHGQRKQIRYEKNARPEKQHSGFHWRTPTTRDQKNIPAFGGGHRKFATSKTISRLSGAAISIVRLETKTTSSGHNFE